MSYENSVSRYESKPLEPLVILWYLFTILQAIRAFKIIVSGQRDTNRKTGDPIKTLIVQIPTP